jgi:hypothetical protein
MDLPYHYQKEICFSSYIDQLFAIIFEKFSDKKKPAAKF